MWIMHHGQWLTGSILPVNLGPRRVTLNEQNLHIDFNGQRIIDYGLTSCETLHSLLCLVLCYSTSKVMRPGSLKALTELLK